MIDLNQIAHSNDTLEIVHKGNLPCVRKTFWSDLDRAQRNVEKQRFFQPIFTGTTRLNAAEVLDFRVMEDRAELLMPYVQGMTGSMFPVHATRNIAHTLSVSLSTLLYSELNASHEQKVPTDLFKEKLLGVASKTVDSDLEVLVNRCSKIVETFPDEMIFPLGPCHGDLTLNNVILDPVYGITLIDFLDTYLESPLQDVAKLKQDFSFGWSSRKDRGALRVKAEIISHYYTPAAIRQIERMYPEQVKLLTLITLARIAPYVRDDVTKNWLVLSLNNCIGDFLK